MLRHLVESTKAEVEAAQKKKQQLYQELAGESCTTEGMLSVTELKQKTANIVKPSITKEYIQNLQKRVGKAAN